jgi:hypothetical protein
MAGMRGSGRDSIARAKSLMAYWASGLSGIKRKILTKKPDVSSPAISQGVQQGRSLFEQDPVNLIS